MKLFNLEKSILLNTKSSWLIGVLNALHRRLQANPPVRSGQPPPAREILSLGLRWSSLVFASLRSVFAEGEESGPQGPVRAECSQGVADGRASGSTARFAARSCPLEQAETAVKRQLVK